MSFSVLSWAIGYALSDSARRARAALFGKTLEKELERAAEAWAGTLPAGKGLYPQALFRFRPDTERLDDRPALNRVRDRLTEQRIPTQVEWHQAFIEQWLAVRANVGEEAQAFFGASGFRVALRRAA